MSINIQKMGAFLDRASEIIIILLFFILPIFIWPGIFEIGSLDKIVIIRTGIEVLLLFKIITWLGGQKIEIKLPKICLWFIFLLASSGLVSSLLSDLPYQAIWGSPARSMGLITWLHIWMLPILISTFDTKKIVKPIMFGLALSGFSAVVIGLMQFSFFDFSFLNLNNYNLRLSSTFTHPAFAGSALLLLSSVAAWLIYNAKSKLDYIISYITFVVIVLGLVNTQTRAAWLGFLVSVVIFVFLLLKTKYKKAFAITAGIICIVIGIYLVSTYNSERNVHISGSVTNRILNVTNVKYGSSAVRLNTWQTGLLAASNKPIFGYGLDNQMEAYYPYYTPEWGINEKINSLPDRAHNELLDWQLTGGIFGLILNRLLP